MNCLLFNDRALFVHFSSFTSLEDRFGRLFLVDRKLNHFFRTENCVNQKDVLAINWITKQYEPFEVTVQRCWERFQFIKRECVRHVRIRFDEHVQPDQEPLMFYYLTEIASSKVIESLSIVDHYYSPPLQPEFPSPNYVEVEYPSSGCSFLNALKKTNRVSNLKAFTWETQIVYADQIYNVDWTVLSQMPMLESITFDMEWRSLQSHQARAILASLPPSLRHVNIDMGDEIQVNWGAAFQAPSFLPNLQTFTMTSNRIPQSLGTRPLRHLTFKGFHDLSMSFPALSLLNSLTSLTLDISRVRSLVFDRLSDTALPQLRIFSLTKDVPYEMISSLDPLLEFLSKRPIEWLSLIPHLGERRQVNAVTASWLSRLTKLKSLCFTAGDASRSAFDANIDELQEIFVAGCFPHLSHLSGHFSEPELALLLRAAPALRTIYVSGKVSPGILAQVGNECPLIQSFTLNQYVDPESRDKMVMHYGSLKAAFDASLLSRNAFQHLVALNLEYESPSYCSAHSMHFLLSKLKHAPKLQFMNIIKPARRLSGAALLEFLVIRDLPFVTEMFVSDKWTSPAFDMFHLPRRRQSSNMKSQYEFVEPTFVSFTDCTPHGLCDVGEYIDVHSDNIDDQLDRLSLPLADSVIGSAAHYRKREYLRFRRDHDASGVDGRSAFLVACYNQLSENDKRLLDTWDNGNYDSEDSSDTYEIHSSDEEEEPPHSFSFAY